MGDGLIMTVYGDLSEWGRPCPVSAVSAENLGVMQLRWYRLAVAGKQT